MLVGQQAKAGGKRRQLSHSILFRNSHAAALSVTTAIKKCGTVFVATSPAGIPFKNTPRVTTRKWRSGFTSVAVCSQPGMFSIGVA